MPNDRFHKAAKEGLIDILKEATRKEANNKDHDSMTPVLWAAFEGHLNALRILCGRGGDPDRCDQFGNTALHLASAKGHLHCVDFLVKFGVNIYALDIDKHCAKDLAAINNRDDILRYLDGVAANLEATDKKKARSLKEFAEKQWEKRMKEYMKRQSKIEQNSRPLNTQQITTDVQNKGGGVLASLRQKIWSSQGNLSKNLNDDMQKVSCNESQIAVKFSELVNSTTCNSVGNSVGRCSNNFQRQMVLGKSESRFTLPSVNALQWDSEVLYVGTFNTKDKRSDHSTQQNNTLAMEDLKSSDVESCCTKISYNNLPRSSSQPDIFGVASNDDVRLDKELAPLQKPGLFDRSCLGSLAFRRSITAALNHNSDDIYGGHDDRNQSIVNRSICGTLKSRSNKSISLLNHSDSDSEGVEGYSDDYQEVSGGSIQGFLSAWGLEEYLIIFQKQQIDLDTLMLLTESDLKTLGLPLGPFRKLTFAIQERKNAFNNPGTMYDSAL